MNLIRLIKLKKINGELDNLTEQEKFFLSFFDDLKTIDGSNYYRNGLLYFNLDKEYKKLHYSYSNVYSEIGFKYGIKIMTLNSVIDNILQIKLGLNGFTSELGVGKPH